MDVPAHIDLTENVISIIYFDETAASKKSIEITTCLLLSNGYLTLEAAFRFLSNG